MLQPTDIWNCCQQFGNRFGGKLIKLILNFYFLWVFNFFLDSIKCVKNRNKFFKNLFNYYVQLKNGKCSANCRILNSRDRTEEV